MDAPARAGESTPPGVVVRLTQVGMGPGHPLVGLAHPAVSLSEFLCLRHNVVPERNGYAKEETEVTAATRSRVAGRRAAVARSGGDRPDDGGGGRGRDARDQESLDRAGAAGRAEPSPGLRRRRGEARSERQPAERHERQDGAHRRRAAAHRHPAGPGRAVRAAADRQARAALHRLRRQDRRDVRPRDERARDPGVSGCRCTTRRCRRTSSARSPTR